MTAPADRRRHMLAGLAGLVLLVADLAWMLS